MNTAYRDRTPHLPLYLTKFIGRQTEVSDIRSLLLSGRLLTLTGAGGSGKTRTAVEAASGLEHAFPDGIWMVELAELNDPALISPAVIKTLGLSSLSSQSLTETLLRFLADRHALLIMDNCEHMLEACALLIAELLQNCQRLHVLATSRAALNLPGEILRPVLPLSLPALHPTQPLAELLHIEAVALFLDRARMRVPDFHLNEANIDSVIRICQLLDGIPLAIELAAARVSVLNPARIADHLQNSLRLLTTAPRLAPARHQTMRVAIEWSYSLLTSAEMTLWRRLAVFRGSFSLAAAEAICYGEGEPSADLPETNFLELFEQLVHKSLVVIVPVEGERRFRLLEPLRQFAGEQMDAAGETKRIHGFHRDWYTAWAEEYQSGLFGAQQPLYLQKFDLEYANLQAALAWKQDETEDGRMGLRLAATIGPLWFLSSRFNEGYRWLTDALNRPGASEATLIRGHALFFASVLTWFMGDFSTARQYIETSHEIALKHQHHGPWGLAYTCMMLGQVVRFFPDEEGDALTYLAQSIDLFRRNGDQWGLVVSLNSLGSVHRQLGDLACAHALFLEAKIILQTLKDPWCSALNKLEYFLTAVVEGDHITAQMLYDENSASFEKLGFTWHLAYFALRMGEVSLREGDYKTAEENFRRCIGFSRRIGHLKIETSALLGLSFSALIQGQSAPEAAQLEDALMRLQNPKPGIEITPFLKHLSSLAAQNGFPRIAAHLMNISTGPGEPVTGPETLSAALAELHLALSTSPAPAVVPSADLTAREVEVLRLVAEGLTDPQIAERLVVSKRTVNAHLRSIYSKLGVSTRTAAVRQAQEQGCL